jgi:two-component system cell cycle sensor histidine kinase/response regulator CckA
MAAMSVPAPTILFVEDDRNNRELMGDILRDAGLQVVEAGTGADALRLARDKPDLVILDVNLPDVSGYEVCRCLRAEPATRLLPVLQVSGVFVHSDDRSHGLEGGADAYLIKPVEPRELLATVRSLLRVHAAEEAARAAAQQWRTTFDAIGDAVFLVTGTGRIARCNRAAADLLRRPFAELIGLDYPRALQEGLRLEEPPPVRAAGTGRQVRELKLGERWFRATTNPLGDTPGAGSVEVLADVTRFKDLEEQLRQGQKMEAIGRLAGGVAHDFNNLLTAILGNANLLEHQLPPTDPGGELVRSIEQAGLRAAELTRQLLGFARQALLWLKPLDLNTAVAEAVAIVRRTLDPRIVVETRPAAGLWLVRADAGQINQVLLNLCLNARDAMPEGGRLTLATANRVLTEEDVRGVLDGRRGEFVCLSIADTGQGIAPELLPRIFEPFFTTKGPGKGTGLGLAMVFGIIRQHQGWVVCHSTVGQGTRFEVYLPRLEGVPERPPDSASARPGGAGTVLVVEDQDLVRTMAVTLLRRNGFEVLTAEDGQAGLEVFGRERQRIDVVLLDLTMPRMSGREVLRHLRQTDPGVRVVFTSGFADTARGELADEGAQGFLAKPYREHDLVEAVRAAFRRG